MRNALRTCGALGDRALPLRALSCRAFPSGRVLPVPSAFSVLFFLEGTHGLAGRTERNPMPSYVNDGLYQTRYAERQNPAQKSQLPPRITRYEPVEVPRGFDEGEVA